ncbi:MAG: MATE family efflux transporter [Acutalibacter sp.]|jgi:multidrug efflux pump
MENAVFTETKVSKAYLRLAVPLVFSMAVGLIYNLADTFFVAQTNDTDIVAGVSLGMPLMTALMAIGNVYAQGGSSLISRLLGKQDIPGVRHASSFCFYGAILTGAVIGLALLVFRVPLLYVLGANEQTFGHASDYFFYLAIGAPVIVLTFIHSNLLRAEGMSKESMLGNVVGSVVNIVLDPIFISVLGWDAAGAAIATVIGNLCTDLFFLFVVLKRSKILSVNPREVRIPWDHVGQILGIGVPAAIVNLMSSASSVVINQFLLPFGNDKIAAMGIAMKVSMIVLLLITGLAFGGQPLFGYYYGSGDKKRLSQLLRFCLKFISAIALGLSILVFVAAPMLMRGFMDNDAIVEAGTVMLRWQVASMVFVGVVLLFTIIFQSSGKVVGSFLLSISRQGVIFLVVILITYNLLGYYGVVMAQAIADLLTAAFAAGLFFKQLYREYH